MVLKLVLLAGSTVFAVGAVGVGIEAATAGFSHGSASLLGAVVWVAATHVLENVLRLPGDAQ